MKKKTALFFSILILLSLAGCGGKDAADDNASKNNNQTIDNNSSTSGIGVTEIKNDNIFLFIFLNTLLVYHLPKTEGLDRKLKFIELEFQ